MFNCFPLPKFPSCFPRPVGATLSSSSSSSSSLEEDADDDDDDGGGGRKCFLVRTMVGKIIASRSGCSHCVYRTMVQSTVWRQGDELIRRYLAGKSPSTILPRGDHLLYPLYDGQSYPCYRTVLNPSARFIFYFYRFVAVDNFVVHNFSTSTQ